MKIEWRKEYRKSVHKLVNKRYWREESTVIKFIMILWAAVTIYIAVGVYIYSYGSPSGNRQWLLFLKNDLMPTELFAGCCAIVIWLVHWSLELTRLYTEVERQGPDKAMLPFELERKKDKSSKIMDVIFLNLVLMETTNEHGEEVYRDCNLRRLLFLYPELEIYPKYLQAGEEIKYSTIIENRHQSFEELCWCLNIAQPRLVIVICLGSKEIRIFKELNDGNCERKIYKGDNITIKDIINYNLKDMNEVFKRRRVCKAITKQEKFAKLDPSALSRILSHCVPIEQIAENIKFSPYPVLKINKNQAARGV